MIVSFALQTESNLIDGKGGCGDVLGNQSPALMEPKDYLGSCRAGVLGVHVCA